MTGVAPLDRICANWVSLSVGRKSGSLAIRVIGLAPESDDWSRTTGTKSRWGLSGLSEPSAAIPVSRCPTTLTDAAGLFTESDEDCFLPLVPARRDFLRVDLDFFERLFRDFFLTPPKLVARRRGGSGLGNGVDCSLLAKGWRRAYDGVVSR
jgi:hypothetical protein